MARAGHRTVWLVVLWGLAACAPVGPEYEAPAPELPAVYAAPLPALFQHGEPIEQWWKLFGDERLNSLVASCLKQNLAIQVAQSRVREARALARGAGARLGPTVSLEAGATAGRTSEGGAGAESATTGTVGTGVAAAWELDLAGGLRRTREAALAEAARREALRREVQRITVAALVRTYAELRAVQRRLELTERSLALLQRTLALVEQQVAAGLSPGLDQVRARAEVASLRADLGPLHSDIQRRAEALAVLLGQPPGALEELVTDSARIPVAATGAALGPPANLVRRRPDVQAAELNIMAATAGVGVAMADLYPRLTLQGSLGVGLAGLATGDVVERALGSLSLLFNVPLFDGGERRANVTAAEERVVQASLTYRETLLGAVQEVGAALLAYEGARQRRESLRSAVADNLLAYEQSRALYRQGLTSFLDVLDSQRQWNAALEALSDAERDQSLATIDVFTAMGGPARPGEEG